MLTISRFSQEFVLGGELYMIRTRHLRIRPARRKLWALPIENLRYEGFRGYRVICGRTAVHSFLFRSSWLRYEHYAEAEDEVVDERVNSLSQPAT
jgi:hypothetical protein